MNKKTLIAISSLGALILPSLVFGQNIAYLASVAAHQVWLVGTWIVIIAWVVTGVLFLAAQGDPGKLKIARLALITSIVGTIVIIIAPEAVGFIQNSLY